MDEEMEASIRRMRTGIQGAADEWKCPITCELPVDPVTAQDGRTYERCAIEEHIHRHRKDELRSPVTNVKMGPTLLTNIQARETIAKLIGTGVLCGEPTKKWKQMNDLLHGANNGDMVSMRELAKAYAKGKFGAVNKREAYEWFHRASDLGDTQSLFKAGECLLRGEGTNQNFTHGMVLMGQAAEQGSAAAAWMLAACFEGGQAGLPKDEGRAVLWWRRVSKAKILDISSSALREAKRRLDDDAKVAKIAKIATFGGASSSDA